MQRGLWLITLLGVLWAGQLQAASFKCHNNFVRLGDRKVTVLMRCGEPLFAEVVSGYDHIKIEEWTYKSRGYKGFLRVLTFHGGRLVKIQVAEKTR